jgi:small subunit ribosomal protein S18
MDRQAQRLGVASVPQSPSTAFSPSFRSEIMSSSFFKKRLSPIKPGDPIDYKDVDLLKKFITERGKILPRRLTGLTAKQQRDLTNAVKRARIVALLPFVNPEG